MLKKKLFGSLQVINILVVLKFSTVYFNVRPIHESIGNYRMNIFLTESGYD